MHPLPLLSRLFATLALLASANFSPSLRAQDAAVPTRPNIVFILADDLGYGDLGCYGQTKIKTPNLDRLAAEGMRFTQVYAGSTVCAPSRCALMTGLHTGHCLVRGNAKVALRPQDRTVAEVLKAAGYRTGAVGKWGLGLEDTTGAPQQKGFDQWVGFLDQTHAHNYYPDFIWRHDSQTGFSGKFPLPGNQGGQKRQYVHDLFTIAATNYIRVNVPSRELKFAPFFLYLAYTLPHANNELQKATGSGNEVPNDAPYANETWPQPEKNKAAMITRLDTDVGKLLDTLKHHKLDESTIVFFSSDNGPHKEGGNDTKFFHSSGGLRGIKRDLYEGGIRVPMIARWPGKIKAGVTNDQVWTFWDFLPTAAELGNAKPPAGLDGISFVPTLLGKAQTNQHEFLYWEFHERGSKQAVRMGDWKAVRLEPGKPLELYQLKSDPAETEDVAAKHPEVVAKIEAYLKTARTESEEWPIRAAPAGKQPEKKAEKQ